MIEKYVERMNSHCLLDLSNSYLKKIKISLLFVLVARLNFSELVV